MSIRNPPSVRPSDREIDALAEVLNRGRKITILGGAGCAGARAEMIEVAARLKAPIVHALRGKEFIESVSLMMGLSAERMQSLPLTALSLRPIRPHRSLLLLK